jgi:hypothetical protein
VVAILRWARREREKTKLYLSVDLAAATGGQQQRIDSLNEVIARHVQVSDLRRVDSREGALEATYFVDIDGSQSISALIDDLQQAFPEIGVSFIDQSRMPTV